MIKLATSGNQVYVILSNTEFKRLAKITDISSIPDGTNISLQWLVTLVDSIAQFQPFIIQAKSTAEELVTKLGEMIQ